MKRKTVPISAWLGAIAIAAALAAGPGCSTTNSESVQLSPQGTHPAGWATTHPAFAMPDGAPCAQCHGSATDNTASGGIAKVSCFSGPRGAQWCHAQGPAFHAPDWLDKASARFHGALTGTLIRGKSCGTCHTLADPPSYVCLNCHFDPFGGRVPPGSTWVHGTVAGHSAFGLLDVLNPVNSVCINCHNVNNTFGHMPQPFCHNCHSPAPAGFHPAGWASPDSHGASAKLAPGAGTTGFHVCQGCHGTNLDGVGGTAPTCINTATCHGAGVASPHSPSPWNVLINPAGRTHTTTSSDNTNAAVCALCHFGGGIHAPTPPPAGSTPGCFNSTLCHGAVGAAPHAVPYLNHPADAPGQFNSFCNTCHTINPPRLNPSAPSCTECHLGGSPLTNLNCTSCHARPPNGLAPVGNVYANIAGAHAKHLALNSLGTPVSCDTCHNGLGTGTLNHYSRANALAGQNALRVPPGDVDFGGAAFPYMSQNGGAASFDNTLANLTCANIRCHGGTPLAPAPNWQSGTISTLTNTGCRLCHKAATTTPVQYNDVTNNVFTVHIFHAFSLNFTCTTCHDTVALTPSAHFGTLSNPTIPAGAARATILTSLNWNPTPPITMSSCTTPTSGCH